MSSNDGLVRDYARTISELVHDGINAGHAWIRGRTPKAFHRLVKSFDRERLYRILDDERHPDKARGIARELAGIDSFSALLVDTNVDYLDPYFLGGFVQGVVEGVDSIPRQAIEQLRLKRQEEIDLVAEYLPTRTTRFSELFRTAENN